MPRKRRPRGTLTPAQYHQDYKARMYTEKYFARRAVQTAIRKHLLDRANTLPCSGAHATPEPASLYHHFLGYEPEHWLDVVPLCWECHALLHAE